MNDETWLVLGIGVVLAALIGAVAYDAATCTQWGPEHDYTYFVQTDNTMIPVTGKTRDCVRHEGDR